MWIHIDDLVMDELLVEVFVKSFSTAVVTVAVSFKLCKPALNVKVYTQQCVCCCLTVCYKCLHSCAVLWFSTTRSVFCTTSASQTA